MYGILSLVKLFGEGKNGINAIIALSFAILSISSRGVLTLVSVMTPWFFVAIFVGFFIIFLLMMFGLKPEQLTAGASSEFRIWPIIIAVTILLFGLGAAFGQQTLEATTGPSESADTGSGDVVISETDTGSTINDGTSPTGSPENTNTGNFGGNFLNTLINPSVLGMILLFLIAAFALFFLTKESYLD